MTLHRRSFLKQVGLGAAGLGLVSSWPFRGAADLEKAKLTSDWLQGYGYQFWRCRHDAFRGDGAFGQFTIVMPERKAVVAITCETGDMQSELNLVWDFLLPAMQDDPLPADAAAQDRLRRKLAALALPLPDGKADSPLAAGISAKTFKIETNAEGTQSVSFRFQGDSCTFTISDAQGEYPIQCGLGRWVDGVSNVPGTPPKITVGDLRPCKVAAAGAWRDETTLEMIWRFYETPHSETVTCQFDGDKVKVEFLTSIKQKASPHPAPNVVLQGVAT